MTRELSLRRVILTSTTTLGALTGGANFHCFTLEDAVRDEKIQGKTAIPAGRYRVTISFSDRFQKLMPEIHGVPGFTGVRFHGGNTAADTEGCPLVARFADARDQRVWECPEALQNLIHFIQDAESHGDSCWVTVS